MKRFFKITFLFLFVSNFISAQEAQKIEAKIESENIEGILKVKAVAKNDGEVYQSLNYIFLSVRKDKNQNMSSSQQQNKFTLRPKETKILSESSVNINKGDALKVFLFIKDEKTAKLISKDSLIVNASVFKNNVAYEKVTNEENMMMKNLIINDTKTRVGDDFYSRFYSQIMLNALQFGYRVRIAELPTTGKNTQIQVFADDDNVLTFNARPEDDFMEDAVKQTIANLIQYEKSKQVADKGFIY